MNIRYILLLFVSLATMTVLPAEVAGGDAESQLPFDSIFSDETLRLDYIFGGSIDSTDNPEVTILSDALMRVTGWAGRRSRLKELPLRGNGQITVCDKATGDTIYRNSFSTLFQEWLSDIAANSARDSMSGNHRAPRAFQNLFLVPMPRRAADITVTLSDSYHRPIAEMTHTVDPSDILIRDLSKKPLTPHRYIHRGGDPKEVIDVAIMAEGYTVEEMDSFYRHAAIAVESIASHEPFKSSMDRFNFIAVASPSVDTGVSTPKDGNWKSTAINSHFSTLYSDRYLTTNDNKAIHDHLARIPYEHVIILANTDEYGGGGIFNLYTLTTARHKFFRPVVVHEFGHSFGGLADEYFYDDDPLSTSSYPQGVEPWEPNITTFTDFSSKWEPLLTPGTPVPTLPADSLLYPVGVYEGGGYLSKGVFRPADQCRMRNNTCPVFCPACQAWLRRLIDFYTLPPSPPAP